MAKFPTIVTFGSKWAEESRNNRTDTTGVWRYIGPGGDVVTRDAAGTPTVTANGNWNNLGYVALQPFDMGATNALTLTNSAGAPILNIRCNGLAPHRISSRLGYTYQKFSSTVGMVWIAARPDGADGLYRRAFTQCDLSLNWSFNPRCRLHVQARNFTASPISG